MLSVHNPGYQGHFPTATVDDVGLPWYTYDWRCLEWYGRVNYLKGGISTADLVVTVSRHHAEELMTQLFGTAWNRSRAITPPVQPPSSDDGG